MMVMRRRMQQRGQHQGRVRLRVRGVAGVVLVGAAVLAAAAAAVGGGMAVVVEL